MPEFNLIPEARSSPTFCFLCGEFDGPFVSTGIDKIEGTVILCAPKYDVDGTLKRSGCVGQIAAAAGYVDPLRWEATNAEHGAELSTLRDAIADLETELDAKPGELDLQPIVDRFDTFEERLLAAVEALAKKPPTVRKPQA